MRKHKVFTALCGVALITSLTAPVASAGPTLAHNAAVTTASANASTHDVLAGREAVSRVHVDAATVVWTDKGLDVQARFDHEMKPLDDVYMNLQEDYHRGEDLSKITIPTNRSAARNLRFLGRPGETLWAAPQSFTFGNKPIWAGFASQVPQDQIENGSLKLKLKEVRGPSFVEVFMYYDYTDDFWMRRLLSSRNSRYQTMELSDNKTHIHTTWAFGKPGTYEMVVQAEGTTPSGEVVTSPERTLVWQVGPQG